MHILKERQIPSFSQLLKIYMLIVSDELQMWELFIMDPSQLAKFSAKVDLAFFHYFVDKSPKLILLVEY